jgi:multiple sugar transport system substrate-binding protein
MMYRRQMLRASAAMLAAPAIISRANAQSAFDWKRFKGQSIEVNLVKSPLADVLQAHQKEFEALTGITVGAEQIPEQQQRPKVAVEFASGRPSFDVVHVALHVQKKQIEKGHWMADLRPMIADAHLTGPDYDFADFGGPGLKAATGPDGALNTIPIKQDLWLTFYNKKIFADRGMAFPKSLDEMFTTAKALTDPGKGVYGYVGRGLKNANLPPYTAMLWGWDQPTISADGRTLLTDSPNAIAAAEYYGKLMRETAPPGSIGFNWNESQTSFAQGRAAMWIDGIGFSAPLIDPKLSKVADSVGFLPVPAGIKGQASDTFIDGIGIAAASKNKGPAWYYVQWATGKQIQSEMLRTGSATPARASVYQDQAIMKGSAFPKEWFETALACLKMAKPGLPEIVGVTEFRDTIGVALTNIIGGADAATEMKKATDTFKPILAKELA